MIFLAPLFCKNSFGPEAILRTKFSAKFQKAGYDRESDIMLLLSDTGMDRHGSEGAKASAGSYAEAREYAAQYTS